MPFKRANSSRSWKCSSLDQWKDEQNKWPLKGWTSCENIVKSYLGCVTKSQIVPSKNPIIHASIQVGKEIERKRKELQKCQWRLSVLSVKNFLKTFEIPTFPSKADWIIRTFLQKCMTQITPFQSFQSLFTHLYCLIGLEFIIISTVRWRIRNGWISPAQFHPWTDDS